MLHSSTFYRRRRWRMFFISQRFEIVQSFRYSISTESGLFSESQPSIQTVVYQFVTSLEILAENCENYIPVIWFSHYRDLDCLGAIEQGHWHLTESSWTEECDAKTQQPLFSPPPPHHPLAGNYTQTTENIANACIQRVIIKLISLNKKAVTCFLLCVNKSGEIIHFTCPQSFCSSEVKKKTNKQKHLDFPGLI